MLPPRTIEELRERVSASESFSYVYFWGHQPSKDGSVGKSCFSQWYEAPFDIDGTIYRTAEHWMMAEKARLFGDEDVALEIVGANDPKTAKALGRKVRNFDDSVWKSKCRDIVTAGNLAKFCQNEKLHKYLSSTGESVLVEASPYDRVWGIGLKQEDKRAANPLEWQGSNLLGFVLMDVRERLSPQTLGRAGS